MRLKKRGLAFLLAIGMLFVTCTDSVLAAENGSNDVVMDSSDEADNVTDQGEIADDANEKADLTDSEEKTDGSEEKDTLTDTDNDADKSDESNGLENSDEIINPGETENSESGNDVEDNGGDEDEAEDVTGEEDAEDVKEIAAVEEVEIISAASDNGEVGRIQWLAELTALFEMSVEKDNYPDNYYSDMDSSSEYYYDAMLATEFGLIDVEAGEELKPDDAASREFAAHTLNFCLGYMPQEDGKYTFKESSEVTYADDIQIAIDRGWFELVNGSFLPDMAITSNEKSEMLADARLVLEAAKPDPTHTNTYTFADDVIDLTKADISVELTDVTELTFYNCSETLAVGNKYGIEQGGLPTVFKITSVTETTEEKVVQFEPVPMDEAFKDIDIQGSMDIDLASVLPYSDDVEMYYIVGGTEEEQWEDGIKYDTLEEVGDQEISAIEAIASYALFDSISQDVNLGSGVKATVTCKVSDVKPDFSASIMNKSAYVGVNAKVSLSCNVNTNLIEAAGIVPNLKLVYIPIAGIGYFDVNMYAMMGGKLTLDMVENVHIGLRYENKTFRMEKSFTKDSFTIQTRIEMEISATAELGMSLCSIMKGEIYAKLGVRNVLDTIVYDDDNTPKMCGHYSAWLYAKVGGSASVNFGTESKSWRKDYNIYDEYNSPVRVSFHYEDGVAVSGCTRGTKYGASGRSWRYYTSANSRYGYNGASSGMGSNGEPYTIFKYSLDEYNNATITSYQGNVSALSIPEMLDGHKVVGIGRNVFRDNSLLRVVVIPDSVVKIEDGAFSECVNLSRVELSSNLTILGNGAFYNCDLITEIKIPKSLKSAWAGPFNNCDGLKKVSFEEGTTEIAEYLFCDCTGIEEIEIPDTVTIIEKWAFYGCANLRKVTIPNSVTQIEMNAFRDCVNLPSVMLSKNLIGLGGSAFNNCDSITEIEIPKSLKSADSGPFVDCDGLRKVSFEEGTTEIAEYLFCNCTGIEEIEIPDTVTIIEKWAFYSCANLRKVTIPNSVTKIEMNAFRDCTKLEKVVIPDSVVEIGGSAFSNCINLSNIRLSRNLTNLGGSAFYNCDLIIEIEIPKSLKSADSGPFKDCDGLKKVRFEEGTTEIAEYLFCDCTGIEKIEIPDTVTIIEHRAFDGCVNLRTVSIPDSVTEIEYCAFQDCTKLEEITLPNSVVTMGSAIFFGCSSLKEAVLPDKTLSVVDRTFRDCISLEKVNFPETLETICDHAFYNTKLTEIVLPEKLKKIEDSAFYNCDALTKVEMQNNLTSIGNYAFYDCDALTAITIPDSVSSLGTYIFAESELLSDVTLGTGITTIPAYAFNLCPSLKKIVIPYRVTEIKGSAFTNCTTLTEITIPRSVTSIASGVFSYPSKLTIYGISGTYAETYANSIGATFVHKEVKATSVSLNNTELKIAKGVKGNLILSIVPSDFTDEVVWKSTDESIVSVDNNGVVNAKSLGTATVKVTVGDLSASCKVTVTQPVTSISLNKTSLSLEALESYKLTATVLPSTAENKEIIWSSSDEEIVSVDENGSVIAHAKGSAVIRVEAQDGSGVYKECNVTVVNNGYLCSNVNELESEHNYPVNSSDFWIYTREGAEKLYVTFDERTDIEEGFDYLYIYDAQGKQVGKYTGTQLAGQVVEVEGNTVKIKLVSDDSGTTWGFKVTSVSADGNVENDGYTVTFDSQGGSMVSAVQVPKNTPVACPTAPVRSGYKFLGWYLNETLYDFSQPVNENIVLRAKWEKIKDESGDGDYEEIPKGDMPENGVIPDGLWIAGVSEQIYTGKALKPDVRVYDGRQRLKAGTDYTISYKNNVKANYDFNESSPSESSPAVIVKGRGNYSGTAKAFFKINPIDITNNPFISADDITLSYNGQSQKKEPKVTYNGKKLSAQKDYTAIYPDAGAVYGAYREVGDYTVKIEGRGNFTGSANVRLSITDKQLIEKAKTVKIKDKAYDNGNAVTLSESELIVYMKSKNEPLTRDVDYKVSYENNCETGTAYAVITGMGDYAGVKKVKFKINGISINTAQIEGIRNKVYNGKEQGQSITVRLNGITLSEGTDYLINYTNDRKKVGTVRMTVKGIGKYTGSIKKSFKITAYDLNMDEQNMISKLPQNLAVKYSAGGAKPGVELKFGDVKLLEGTDYKISCKNNKNIADLSSDKVPTAVIKGIGNFKGSISVKFSIKKKNIADAEDALTLIVADVAYVNKAGKYISKPILRDSYGNTLKAGSDYAVTYMLSDGVTKLTEKDIVPVNTEVCLSVIGKGKYEGTLNATYTVKSNSLQKAKIKITPKSYTGTKVYLAKEDITVMLGNDNRLVYGVDYEIAQGSYVNNTKKGTASVVIKGKGNYAGMKTVRFKITARRMEAFDSVVRKLSGIKGLF